MKKSLVILISLLLYIVVNAQNREIEKGIEKYLNTKDISLLEWKKLYNVDDSINMLSTLETFTKYYNKDKMLSAKLVAETADIIHKISLIKNPSFHSHIATNILKAANDTTLILNKRNYLPMYLKYLNKKYFNTTCKQEIYYNLTNKKLMLNDIILIAGYVEDIKDLKRVLQKIVDSNINNAANYAQLALCRIGDKKQIQSYLSYIQKNSTDIVQLYSIYRENLEYIKQKIAIDIIIEILFSERTETPIKETMAPQKIATAAIYSLSRCLKNFPFKDLINDDEANYYIKEAREWIKKNRNNLIINRDVY